MGRALQQVPQHRADAFGTGLDRGALFQMVQRRGHRGLADGDLVQATRLRRAQRANPAHRVAPGHHAPQRQPSVLEIDRDRAVAGKCAVFPDDTLDRRQTLQHPGRRMKAGHGLQIAGEKRHFCMREIGHDARDRRQTAAVQQRLDHGAGDLGRQPDDLILFLKLVIRLRQFLECGLLGFVQLGVADRDGGQAGQCEKASNVSFGERRLAPSPHFEHTDQFAVHAQRRAQR